MMSIVLIPLWIVTFPAKAPLPAGADRPWISTLASLGVTVPWTVMSSALTTLPLTGDDTSSATVLAVDAVLVGARPVSLPVAPAKDAVLPAAPEGGDFELERSTAETAAATTTIAAAMARTDLHRRSAEAGGRAEIPAGPRRRSPVVGSAVDAGAESAAGAVLTVGSVVGRAFD